MKKFPLLMRFLIQEESGSIFIAMAASIFLIMAAVGAAVDMARAQTLQARMSNALDAAGLAAGGTSSAIPQTNNPATGQTWTQAQWVQAQAQKYYNVNFPSGYLGANNASMTATLDTATNIVTLNASANQKTTIMPIMGINSLPIAAASQITRQNNGLEVALVLDNTGSMGNPVNSANSSVPKIDALQCALAGNAAITWSANYCTNNNLVTTGLLDILYGNNPSLYDLFVSVVPFADVVNIPANQNQVVLNASGAGCVTARSASTQSSIDGQQQVIIPPATTATAEKVYLDTSEDAPQTTNAGSPTNFSPFTYNSGSSNHPNYVASPDCPAASLLPLTQTKSTVVTAIQKMTPNGATMLNLGMAWGWRTISQYWQSSWKNLPTYIDNAAVSHALPLNYGTANMTKVVILMTDGINNTDTSGYSAYGSSYPTNSQLDIDTLTICTALKKQGVVIYTIGFGVATPASYYPLSDSFRSNSGSYVDSELLSACATDSAHAFVAPTNAQLANAFQQIGNALANLRVSK